MSRIQGSGVFQLPGVHGSATQRLKQLLFRASGLCAGEYTVTVNFTGSQSRLPPAVYYFYIQSLTTAQQAGNFLSSSSSGPLGHSKYRVKVGAVLGSVIPTMTFFVEIISYWRSSLVEYLLSESYKLAFMTDEMVFTCGASDESSINLLTLKYEQRLAVLQNRIQQRDQQLVEGSAQLRRMVSLHIGSGMRLTEEDALRLGYDAVPIEVPPGYTVE
ncbi:hypothetical protein GYMLUDRAFT_242469 [Collybiopsis luxurians FD-317 M1]|uniref:Uncharacterized protein n=1 Tax=Collybiopsis luxurians FD-317 M1 TaxID=944289 RepID=A0A0D0D169_9AGAR|nr:hypothetical protein GYMLUDRAFT_242469 [Collybiopsis luxurians FD-317 M1]